MRIGVDLGGTKTEAILLDGSREVARRRVDTPRGDYEATIAAVVDLVRALEARAGGPASVGVGIPGTLSRATGLVKNANSTWLIGRPLAADLERRLERPVRLANDANCFAASEAADGAGAGAEVVFGAILGTGVGAGIVVRGHVLSGANHIAGEWGHNPLPWPERDESPGPACYCGRRGCVETFLSGPGMQDDDRRHTGRSRSPREIVEAAGAGEPAALAVMRRYEDRLARALAAVINLLDPDVIVLGGGMSNVARLYEAVPQRWEPYVFACRTGDPTGAGQDAGLQAPAVRTRLLPARHGDSSGVRGAAWLWPDERHDGTSRG